MGLKEKAFISAKQRLFASATSLPINIRSCGNLLIYPDQSLTFNRIKKAGNSSVMMYNLDVIKYNSGVAGSANVEYRKTKKEASAIGKRLGELRFNQIRNLCHHINFTVCRNPYERVLSAFRQKVILRAKENINSPYRLIPGFSDDSAEGFRKFINFLERGGLFHDRHWWPQVDLLAMPIEYFDFIIGIETLPSELPKVYKSAGLSIPEFLDLSQPHLAEATDENKISGSSEVVWEYYDEEMSRRVAKLYAADFKSFGYSFKLSGSR